MTEQSMALADLLQKSGDGDFLRTVAEAVLQSLMEADVEGLIGAGRHERSAERLNWRNGDRGGGKPNTDTGGEVILLRMDEPIRRMLGGIQDRFPCPCEMTDVAPSGRPDRAAGRDPARCPRRLSQGDPLP